MTLYTITLHTLHHWATAYIEANTQDEAEDKARHMFESNSDIFEWTAYSFDRTLEQIVTIDETVSL